MVLMLDAGHPGARAVGLTMAVVCFGIVLLSCGPDETYPASASADASTDTSFQADSGMDSSPDASDAIPSDGAQDAPDAPDAPDTPDALDASDGSPAEDAEDAEDAGDGGPIEDGMVQDGFVDAPADTIPTPQVVEISIVPSYQVVAMLGCDLGYEATAVFDDNASAVVTLQAAWSSDHPEIAIVESPGVVRPIAVGNTTIRAALQGVEGQAALVVMNGGGPQFGVVPATLTLTVGGGAQLDAVITTYLCDGGVDTEIRNTQSTWTSNDESVASVQGGWVLGHAAGFAVVTAALWGATSTANITVISVDAGALDGGFNP